MNPLRRIAVLFLAFSAAGTAFSAEPNLEFTGVLATGSTVKIALRDKTDGASRWLTPGESFRGYTFKSFDPGAETATLLQDGREVKLALPNAKVRQGGDASAPLTRAQAEAIFHNLRQIAAAADQYFLENGKAEVPLSELVGPTRYIKKLVTVAGEDYGVLGVLKQGVPLTLQHGGDTISLSRSSQDIASSSFYVVRPGDTVAKIAATAQLSPTELMALNEGKSPARLQVGELLRLKK